MLRKRPGCRRALWQRPGCPRALQHCLEHRKTASALHQRRQQHIDACPRLCNDRAQCPRFCSGQAAMETCAANRREAQVPSTISPTVRAPRATYCMNACVGVPRRRLHSQTHQPLQPRQLRQLAMNFCHHARMQVRTLAWRLCVLRQSRQQYARRQRGTCWARHCQWRKLGRAGPQALLQGSSLRSMCPPHGEEHCRRHN
mmetsp:Transcript_20372/g.38190  ORF Transcript_20372/g.38190 Transcript_20372/m.38190 type:complete len:200 (-) Transcript_20372:94-693(-)